jgi:WD40 repeat protein
MNKKMTGIVLATANVEGTITHWDFKTGRSLSTIKDEEAHFLSMDFSHDGK